MVSNIIEEVKKGLTGDPLKDIQYLQEQAAKYKDSPDSAEILKILSGCLTKVKHISKTQCL